MVSNNKIDRFPYIKSLYVYNCYAHKKFNILLSKDNSLKHLILTGKNGSGKTTILDRIHFFISSQILFPNNSTPLDSDESISNFRMDAQTKLEKHQYKDDQEKLALEKSTDLMVSFINNKAFRSTPSFRLEIEHRIIELEARKESQELNIPLP